jgi:hypothetical protein
VLDDSIHNFSNTNSDNITANGEIINTESYAVIDILGNSTGSFVYGLGQHVNTHYGIFYKIDDSNYTISKTISTFDNTNLIIDPIALTIDTNQNIWIAYDNKIVMWNPVTETTISILEFEGYVDAIAGTNTNELLVINRNNNTNYIYTFNVNTLLSSRDIINTTNRNSKFIAMGDWSGFRKQNKYTDLIEYYTNSYLLTGQSQVFNILPRNKYRLEKINEDFDMTETIKSYRTTETMLNYDLLFDQFLGGIFGNKYDDGTFLGRNLYEKIANFVMNHSDIDTCNVKSLKSMCEQVNISFENDIIYPRDIKKIIDLFSIKFKYLWGDTIREGDIQEYKGQEIDIYTYVVSANPPVKFIVEEKFNEHLSVITPLGIYYSDFIYRTNYPLSTYNDDWGWGLSIPYGQQLSSYYKFYELLDVNYSKLFSIIDWNNELTSIELSSITSYDSYFSETGVASIMLGDKLRQGLGLFL